MVGGGAGGFEWVLQQLEGHVASVAILANILQDNIKRPIW